MNSETKSITVFFPAYNEEENIEKSVMYAIEVLKSLTDDYEIIIIDDASIDKTGKITDDLAKKYSNIRVFHHNYNKKLGGCLKTGFYNATKNLILYSDADIPFDMYELKKAIRVMNLTGADVISAYRLDRTSEGTKRIFYSFIYNFLIKLLFGLSYKDINFSFKLCKKEIFESIRLVSKGSFIDAELLIKCKVAGFTVVQIGVDFFPRDKGKSTLSSPLTILGIIKEMCCLFFRLKFRKST